MLIIQSSIAKPHYFCDEKKFKRIDSALPILVLLPFRLFTGNGLNWGKAVEQQECVTSSTQIPIKFMYHLLKSFCYLIRFSVLLLISYCSCRKKKRKGREGGRKEHLALATMLHCCHGFTIWDITSTSK